MFVKSKIKDILNLNDLFYLLFSKEKHNPNDFIYNISFLEGEKGLFKFNIVYFRMDRITHDFIILNIKFL